MRSLLFSYLFFLFALPFLQGQSMLISDSSSFYIIEDDYPNQNLFEKTQILYDSTGSLQIEEIIANKEDLNFRLVTSEEEIIQGCNTLWLHLKIFPEVAISDWWLLFKRPQEPYEFLCTHEEVDFYFVENGKLSRHEKTGVYVPASEKAIPEINSISRVPISFQEGKAIELFIRIKDAEYINTIVQLRNPVLGLPTLEWNMMLAHFTLIICLYVLCFFFFTRDWSYLYLFGMLFCLYLHYYILHPYTPLIDWFFPENPRLILIAWPLLTTMAYIFFLQFGRGFTNLKTLAPRVDRLVVWGIGFLTVVLLLRIYVDWNSQWIGSPSAEIAVISMFSVVLAALVRMAFIKNKLVHYFVFGGLWLILFSIYGALWQTGVLPFFDNPNPWVVAQTGFLLIFALALAHKIQISEKARSEVDKVKELDSIKSKFFANISHEFRTPLSLILGPINQSIELIPASEKIEDTTEVPVKGRYLKVMRRNALRLQNLVDQLLDLSKLDQGKMQLAVAEGDIVHFIRAIVFSFESLAERKHIHFHTQFPETISSAYFDSDKLEKILVNLLSNAFKFTPEHGKVGVQMAFKGNMFIVTVADTGNGMHAEEVAKIFDRFYQVEETRDQGSGIGLSLVKELVELHRGQISASSTKGEGTIFKVSLPYQKADFQMEELAATAASVKSSKPILDIDFVENNAEEIVGSEDQPLLLIVEDNSDLRQYIAEQMASQYQIITAKDGKEGLQMAVDKLPDLILSDVMMPRLSGTELCQTLKSEIKTSHIPVILLTAKAGQDAKLLGLEAGADDYLTKPFDGRELRVRSKNLIEQRQKLREKFGGELQLRPKAVKLSSMEEVFLQKVMEVIEENMGNEFFSVQDLANAVGFSRSQLSRKLKALTDKSSNQLIREFRLTRAKELLEQRAATVSEVAYQVGYANLSYFSKSYKETFGILPTET